MLKSNPMRISSESLDLDDIISDLNSSSQMSKKAPNETTESQRTLKQETKKITKTAPKSGKENDSKAANKADTVVKARILSEIAQTTETKAATNEKEPNKRYAASESELKIDMED